MQAARDALPAPGQLGSVLPPAEQVHVDVVDKLAAATAHMHAETIPLRHNVPLRCQVFNDQEQLPHQGDVLFLQVVHGGNVQFRDDQNVYGGLWVNVGKGHDRIVFVHDSGWCTPGDDITENTRHNLQHSPIPALARLCRRRA